ncbi:MAG: 50S ribosomal protein L21 [Bacteriovoracaceae bacterium]|jgi:large subunit ribosomal protein L21|nr:50S ribosomal protein L21 [Bacteriovoracaceae bacterium]
MYGVVEVSGHQYRVELGDVIDVERLDASVGDSLDLDQVLFVGGDNAKVGTPTINGAVVKAKVVRQARDRKVIVFKRKPGQYQKKRGHRQHYTGLLVTEISDGAGATVTIDKEHPQAKKHL